MQSLNILPVIVRSPHASSLIESRAKSQFISKDDFSPIVRVHAWCSCACLSRSILWWAVKSGFRKATRLLGPFSIRRWPNPLQPTSHACGFLQGASLILRSSLCTWINLLMVTIDLSVCGQITLCSIPNIDKVIIRTLSSSGILGAFVKRCVETKHLFFNDG